MVADTGDRNVELAVIEEVTAPVWPDTTVHPTELQRVDLGALPIPAAAVDSVRTAPQLPILQSVVWDGRDLEIELSRRSRFEIDLQARNHPLEGAWRVIGRVRAGVLTCRVSGAGVEDNAQLRLLAHLPGADAPTTGAPVPATDLDQTSRPPAGGGRRHRITTSNDLLSDDLGYLAVFGDQLAALAQERRAAGPPPSPTGERAGKERSTNDGPHHSPDEVRWRWEQRARSFHGPAITGFALGLPPAAAAPGWEDFRESVGELTTDSALSSRSSETATRDDSEQEPIDHRRSAPSLQQKRRQWVRSYAELARRCQLAPGQVRADGVDQPGVGVGGDHGGAGQPAGHQVLEEAVPAGPDSAVEVATPRISRNPSASTPNHAVTAPTSTPGPSPRRTHSAGLSCVVTAWKPTPATVTFADLAPTATLARWAPADPTAPTRWTWPSAWDSPPRGSRAVRCSP